MKQIELHIDGMHCLSCAQLIEECLKDQVGVLKARVNYKQKTLKLKYDEKVIHLEELKQVIAQQDYQLMTKEEQKQNKIQVIWAIALVLLSYYLIERLLPDFSGVLGSTQKVSLILLFVIGLTTSFHCVSMCGGMALSQLVRQGNNVKRSFLYNVGRVISYTLLGGMIGALGSFMTTDLSILKGLPILLGLAMMVMGVSKLGIVQLNLITLPKRSSQQLGRWKKKMGSGHGPLIVGLLNGLMPCGPLQLMQLYALGTGSFLQGALAMFFFSLGTVPLMLGMGIFMTRMSAYAKTFVFKVGGALIIVLGLNMMTSGLATLGIRADLSLETANRTEANLINDKQVVSVDLERRQYKDIVVKKGIPVEFVIDVEPGTLNGCNHSVIIPEFGIQKNLEIGSNIITFTPTKTGTFTYSCWMGMIRNSIKVIE